MICFVMLHYLVFEETCACADSILNNTDGEKVIVIADNASPNDSYQKLCAYYADDPRVHLLRNDTNAGYAAGINLGYRYARDHFACDFIVCMNNDMEIVQRDFIDRIRTAREETGFYVLGPDIWSTSARKHQNPEKTRIRTREDVEEQIRDVRRVQSRRWLLKVKGAARRNPLVRKLYYSRGRQEENSGQTERLPGAMLHGACLVFSEDYIKRREYALNPGTEFYCEAQILDYECWRDGMLTVYDPAVRIRHHEDVATDAAAGTYEKKMLAKCEKVLQSLQFMEEMIDRDSRQGGKAQ